MVDMAAGDGSSFAPYLLGFENRPGYFYIRFTGGHQDLDRSRQAVQEAAEALRESGHQKVLAVMDFDHRMPFADIFWMASELPELNLLDRIVASVDLKPEHEPFERFAEAAANYFDLQRRAFATVEEAEKWLASC